MKFLIAPVIAVVMGAGAAGAQQAIPGGHFIEQWDGDGDGTVTTQEFIEATDKLLSGLDRNGDGVLSLEDFGRG